MPEDTSTATPSGQSPATEVAARPLVFISYRVDPDAPLADAFKKLIESVLEPPPEVFVSGAGGLRPSALFYPTQLQTAAKRANAFVGIITAASKDRTWIQFEAGAAWGRGILYAPLLVDVSPSELETNISAYQATSVDSPDALRLLMESMAQVVTASVHSRRFAQRAPAFERAVKKYRSGKDPEDEPENLPGPADKDPILVAGLMLSQGKKQEAEELFKAIEKTADATAMLDIRFSRLAYDFARPAAERLLALEALGYEVKQHPEYLAVHGMLEADPQQALIDCRSYIDKEAGSLFAPVFKRLVTLHRDLGQGPVALALLERTVLDGNRDRRATAALLYNELWDSDVPLARLLVATIGFLAKPGLAFWDLASGIASELSWPSLRLYFAFRYNEAAEGGHSANELGRACDHAGLPALAYEYYKKSVSLGVSVAKVNIASLFSRGAVASAGLELLSEHEGSFDSKSTRFPFEIRSSLEETISTERAKFEKLRKAGKQAFIKICSLVSSGLPSSSDSSRLIGKYKVSGTETTIHEFIDPSAVAMIKSGNETGGLISYKPHQRLRWLFPGRAIAISISGEPLMLIFSSGGLSALHVGADESGEWTSWTRVL